MKIILTGIQGSGKSTQGTLLSKQLDLPYLSTGHIFRQIAKEKTSLGRYVKETVNSGLLIPDEKVMKIVSSYLERPEYKKGYIIDGFPRTVNQAKKFKNGIEKVIYLDIPDKEALWRLAYRNSSNREDENLMAIRKRISIFHKHTEPVIRYYQKKGKLVTIDGTDTIGNVNEEILKSLGKQLVRNKIEKWRRRKKIILALVGLPGAGKTAAANFFSERGFPNVHFGQVVNDLIKKQGLKNIEKTHKKVREEIREKYGMEAMAVLNENKIRRLLKKSLMVVIDGMRSWEEYIYLKKKFADYKLYIVAVYADKHLRWKRLNQLKKKKGLYGEERDIDELFGVNMAPTIAYADFLIKNNFDIRDFKDKLGEVYRVIYFS